MDITLQVRQIIDSDADASYIGRYTDTPETWAIICATGEYCAKVEQRNRIIAACEERIEENINDNPAFPKISILRERARIAAIERSGETEYPPCGREYRFFVPYAGGETQGTADYKKYGLQDFARMESLNRGDWHHVGIVASVTLETDDGFTKTIESGGIWGVESDAGDYLQELAREQIDEIRAAVAPYGEMPEWNGEFIV